MLFAERISYFLMPFKEQKHPRLFSINQTARVNGINVFNYIQRLFIKLPETPISQVDQFLPWNNDIFDEFGDYED